MMFEQDTPAHSGSPSSSASSSFSSSTLASRRNSFSISEKPPDGLSSFSSFSSLSKLPGLASSRVSLLPMPVMTSAATSALDVAKSYIQKIPIAQRVTIPSYAPLSGFSPSVSMLPPRFRSLFGNCLYRRVVLWIAAFLTVLLVVLLAGHSGHGAKFGFGKSAKDEPPKPRPEDVWLNYTRLDSYYNGVRAVVPMDKFRPEFPSPEDKQLGQLGELSYAPKATESPAAPAAGTKDKRDGTEADKKSKPPMPTPTRYRPQPDYNSSDYRAKYYPVKQCYLDADSKVPAPELWAYNGLPQGHPDALLGSHSLLGIRDDVCFERFGRYGPYGLGYSKEEGGTGQGFDTENEGNEVIWSEGGKFDYSTMDWGAAQKRCYEANKDRFVPADKNSFGATEISALEGELKSEKRDDTVSNSTESASNLQKLERIAVVVRCYAGFKWTPHAVLNFRALVNEVALQSGGEYDVHILLHARDEGIPIWADRQTADEFIAANVPAEFRSMVSLWAEGQMRMLYPGLRGQPSFENPSNADIHGVYRSAHLPLQHFAQQHPEYAHYWNWEMDMRFLGSYYEFFDRLGRWSDAQPRRRLWDRAAKYYIPALHGSWENFTAQVDAEAHAAGRPSILGKMMFGGRTNTRDEDNDVSPLPQGCEGASLSTYNRTKPDNVTEGPGRHFFADLNNNYTDIPEACGVNEPADLITLNPLFDAEDSGWVFANDISGYDMAFDRPPRRTAIITASRLSRRLLFAMHEESWRLNHAMFAEMFPPSIALHRGFKATYAPHPVFTDRRWPLAAAEKAFNAGPDHSSGAGRQSPFDPGNEHFHRGMTWYYNSDFAGRLWRRWLGYLQPINDPQQPKPSSNSTDDDFLSGLAGGKGEEERDDGTGRMCLRSMLVHPIKFESLEEIFV